MDKQSLIAHVESAYMNKELPELKSGYTVRVHVRIKEWKYDQKKRKWEVKERIQPYEGIIIRMRGSGIRRTITVRRVAYGVGVERIFPLYSPNVVKVEVLSKVKPKRKVLTFIRNLSSKMIRRKLKELRE